MGKKYFFASTVWDVDAVAEIYGVPVEVIEDCLDSFFASNIDEYEKTIDGRKKLRIIRHNDVIILQLARKSGRGYTVTKHPWFFVFKKLEEAEK